MSAVDEAEKAAHEACPCALRHDGDNTGTCLQIACKCYSKKIDRSKHAFGWPGSQESRPICGWPGHAAIRALRSAAFEAGLEAAAKVAESCICEEGDLLHRRNCPIPFPAQAIRSLAAKEASGVD